MKNPLIQHCVSGLPCASGLPLPSIWLWLAFSFGLRLEAETRTKDSNVCNQFEVK